MEEDVRMDGDREGGYYCSCLKFSFLSFSLP